MLNNQACSSIYIYILYFRLHLHSPLSHHSREVLYQLDNDTANFKAQNFALALAKIHPPQERIEGLLTRLQEVASSMTMIDGVEYDFEPIRHADTEVLAEVDRG